MRVGLFIYSQAEVLDFSGPFEVFTTANRLLENDLFEVCLIAPESGVVNARGDFKVVADYGIDQHPELDLLIVVGGYHNDIVANKQVVEWLIEQGGKVSTIGSVCTGVFLWAETGILSGRDVTTHHEDIADLKKGFFDINVVENQRWIEFGNFISSGGISAGIDMSLRLLERYHSRGLAIETAAKMELNGHSFV